MSKVDFEHYVVLIIGIIVRSRAFRERNPHIPRNVLHEMYVQYHEMYVPNLILSFRRVTDPTRALLSRSFRP